MGILLRGIEKDQVERGQVLAKPERLLHTEFDAKVYVLTKEEGEGILLSSPDTDLNSSSEPRT